MLPQLLKATGSLRACALCVHFTDPPSSSQPMAMVGFPRSVAVCMFPPCTSFLPLDSPAPILKSYALLTALLPLFLPLRGLPSIIYSAAETETEACTAYRELRHPALHIPLCILSPVNPGYLISLFPY